jgi:hypothetical protein
VHPSDLTLNAFVDLALAGAEQADVERHLAACERCRTLVGDLREIRRAAGALGPIEPPAAAWSRIDASIRAEDDARLKPSRSTEPPEREGFAVPPEREGFARATVGWLVLAATLILATVIGLRLGPLAPSRPTAPTTTEAPAAAGTDAANTSTAESVESEMRQAEDHYDKAIKGLEQIAQEGEGEIDPAMAATLKKNLATVDQAIDESRAAVRSEPTSEPARNSLLDNFATKITLLQDTVSLINEMRKGNDAGAAQIVSGLK